MPEAVATTDGGAGFAPALAQAAAQAVAQAFVQACTLDVAVCKPGNVSLAAAGHGMQASQFIAAARAAAPALVQPQAGLGERVLAAVRASWQAAGCNTNLGIVLLCAPLAMAAQRCAQAEPEAGGALSGPGRAEALRLALRQVLTHTDAADAQQVYAAIALANPGGLGRRDEHDVRQPPRIGLLPAMALAAADDSIARLYVGHLAELFDLGLPWLLADGRTPADAAHATAQVQRAYLGWLSAFPDSHIVRKHGAALAHTVMVAAQRWQAEAPTMADLPAPQRQARWLAWDAQLKQQGLNPGTSADLTVATLMLAGLLGWRAPADLLCSADAATAGNA